MIDFKEKLHNDVNEILNESIVIDEGIGSALASSGKMLGKGLVKGGQLAASGAKSLKNKYKDYKINKNIKSQEVLVNKATDSTKKIIMQIMQNMQKGIDKLNKVEKLEDAKELMEQMIKASNTISKKCKVAISVYDSALKAINSEKDNNDYNFF